MTETETPSSQTTEPVFVRSGSNPSTRLSLDDLIRRYRNFSKASAENVLKLAETVILADDQLARIDFRRFCEEVGLDQEGSKFRKVKAIGKKVSRFEPFIEQMPNNWTTLYKLASITDEEFERVTQHESFSPWMTSQDLVRILKGPSKSTAAPHRDLWIDLSDLEDATKIEAYNELRDLEQRFKFALHPVGEFAKLIKDHGTELSE